MSKAVVIPGGGRDLGGMKEELTLSPTKKGNSIGLLRFLRLDALGKKNSVPASPTSTEPPTTYYGVYIPCELKKGPDEEAIHVYKNKAEALELMKRYKLSRFKAFQNHQDAVSFALRGAEPTDTTDGNDNSLMGEKPYPFKAPSPQDMVALRKAIEKGLTATVRDRVWDNPRFLVSSGNTPAIMQEGSRYNALHVAAKAMNAELCDLVLTTVGSASFVQRLYGSDADALACEVIPTTLLLRVQEGSRYNARLCDLVLTTVGSASFVQRLYGSDADALACEVIPTTLLLRVQEGSRYNARLCDLVLTTVGSASFVQRLYGSDADALACEVIPTTLLLRVQEDSRYNARMCDLVLTTVGSASFVQRLYGSDADALACEAMNETPLHFAAKFGGADAVDVLTSFSQCNKSAVNKYGEQPKDVICKRADNTTGETAKRIASMLRERFYVPVLHTEDGSAEPTIGRPFTPALPPEINTDPLSPRYEIRAYAGPMESRDADSFRRKWKTPPRQPRAVSAFRLAEMTKGFENVGRNLAEEMKVGWKEYWPFLDTFTDLRSPEGLHLLEEYLKAKYESACSFAYGDSCAHSSNAPDDLSISRISLNISHNGDNTMSPMTELCVALKTCKITNRPVVHRNKTDPIRQRMCRQPSANSANSSKVVNGDVTPAINHTVSPLLCIERTCQVFAKRIADALTFSLTAEPEVAGDSLKSEAKHLQHTIFTYMDDERFQKIEFALTHSRLAQLVVYKLKQQTTDLDDINNLTEFLLKLRCPNDDIFSSDDERKTSFTFDDRKSNYRSQNRAKVTHVIDGHVRCLASFICEELTEDVVAKGPAVSDECSEIWERAAKCRCDWKIDSFERNSKKNASFRKNRSVLSTSPKMRSLQKWTVWCLTLSPAVSNWLRVTGANSPRSSLASKSMNHNFLIFLV
ncbi:Uncharacterized protein OBRU01_11933 [Operophtera brumata]|uniref:ANKLE2 third alpha/beta domain-containing protein n=1 Tax=Operophtera brumata TaxID=104452 RepID=A0A0L7LB42_OPEBR|nr:Uncharacterized protein OBRU01_11933 [Operophtera brumata]